MNAKEILKGLNEAQIASARRAAEKWAGYTRQLRAWSCPYALRYGDDWEFAVVADMNHPSGQENPPDEIRDLRALSA